MELPAPTWTNAKWASHYRVVPRTITRWRAAGVNLMDPEAVLGQLMLAPNPPWSAICNAESLMREHREHRLRKRPVAGRRTIS